MDFKKLILAIVLIYLVVLHDIEKCNNTLTILRVYFGTKNLPEAR